MSSDNTKEMLEQIVAQLYAEQAAESSKQIKTPIGSYLIAEDGQLLGNLNNNKFDQNSILNKYGLYGSKYSNTSIFNKYSPYGSKYGAFSLCNPYCGTPPKLFIKGQFFKFVTNNQYVNPKISPEAFFYSIQNDINSAILGVFVENETGARANNRQSFIEAQDGVFLGKLKPSAFDSESIFNKFSPYGSKFSQTTFLNKFSPYGNQFSQLSAYNRMAQSPPKIYLNGKHVGFLTKNLTFSERIDPDNIFEWAERNVSKYIS